VSAAQHPFRQIQSGLLRLGQAADGAGVQQRLVACQAQQLELKGRLYQRQGLLQLVQGIHGVEDEGQKPGVRPSLLGHQLGDLGKIGAQSQLLHVLPDAPEELQRLRLVEGKIIPVLEQRHVRPDQKLG
jgi:hypothetical protein